MAAVAVEVRLLLVPDVESARTLAAFGDGRQQQQRMLNIKVAPEPLWGFKECTTKTPCAWAVG